MSRCPAVTYGGATAILIRCKLPAGHPQDHVPPTKAELEAGFEYCEDEE